MDPKLSYEQVERLCIDVIAAKSGMEPRQVRREDRLAEDLGFDSMGLVDLLMDVEDHLPATLPEDEPGLQTADDVLRWRVMDLAATLHKYQR